MWSRGTSGGSTKAARLILAAVVLLAAGPALAQDDDDAPGRPADTLRYPFAAALSRTNGDARVYFCGGALIAPQWILTAAHCFSAPGGARITARDLWAEVGASMLRDVPANAQVRVARIVIHPGYDADSHRNDIALVRLERVVGPLTADIETRAAAPRPITATMLGFGALFEGSLARSRPRRAQVLDRLRQVAVRPVPAAECGAGLDAASELCATSGPAETCIGDSGSALVAAGPRGADRLIGILSFGSPCEQDRPVTAFIRIAAYAGWIADTLARQ